MVTTLIRQNNVADSVKYLNIVDMQVLEQKKEANDLIEDFQVFKIPFLSNT